MATFEAIAEQFVQKAVLKGNRLSDWETCRAQYMVEVISTAGPVWSRVRSQTEGEKQRLLEGLGQTKLFNGDEND